MTIGPGIRGLSRVPRGDLNHLRARRHTIAASDLPVLGAQIASDGPCCIQSVPPRGAPISNFDSIARSLIEADSHVIAEEFCSVMCGGGVVVSARRIRGMPIDTGELHGFRVDPGTVVVAVGDEDRPVRDDRVELGRCRYAAAEVRQAPAAADDPLDVGVFVGVLLDHAHRLPTPPGVRQVALRPLHPGLGRVNVRVREAREQQPTSEVGYFRRRDGQLPNLLRVGDHDDPTVTDPDGEVPAMPITIEDVPVDEDLIQAHAYCLPESGPKPPMRRRCLVFV